MKSLDELTKGEKGVVATLIGGGAFLSRITAMGFTPNTAVFINRNNGRGPLLVTLRDTEVALGRGEAEKIIIQEECFGK